MGYGMVEIYVIILNYNNYTDSYECIKSVQKIAKENQNKINIVFVDNCSTDDSYSRIKEEFCNDIFIIRNDKNLGYAGGNNIGIKYALNNHSDYICVLNNDTIIQEDFFGILIEKLNEDNKIGFISPAIEEYSQDIIQSTGGDINLKRGVVTANNFGAKRVDLEKIIECDYIGGACMFFRSSFIEKIGLMPENYFLFFEETEWCYRAKNIGYKNICVTSTYVKHKGSASINKTSGLSEYLMERNRIVFLKRNYTSRLKCYCSIMYLFMKNIYLGLFRDKHYFSYLRYMYHGLRNKVDYKKYPFIIVK